jgi:hypothetical protein
MEAFDPSTQEGMRMLIVNAVYFCRKELETSGDFEQHFGLRVGNETQDFKLSTRAAASSLTRIFEEAHKAARRTQANTLILMLRHPMASINGQLALEVRDSILIVTQTERRTAIAMLPFRQTNTGFEFEELQKGECETETFATPQVIFQKLGYVADVRALDHMEKGRRSGSIWN